MSLGILTIATNRYYDYWVDMIKSFEKSIPISAEQTFYVFTDQISRARQFAEINSHLDIRIHEIESMGFPEATLLRYEVYKKFKHHLTNDVLMHLDADMLIRSNKLLSIEEKTLLGVSGITLVSHPGYWRPAGHERIKLLLLNPSVAIRDIKNWIKFGGLGAWEVRNTSGAFVPRGLRTHYVCGGIWAGTNNEFKQLCTDLSEKTQSGLALGHVPIWHDESYLNYWASKNKFELLNPSYCFDPRYPQLSNLENIVEAVNKNV